MIGKQDVLDRAGEWRLRPDVVEKDYVLGWLLAAIARHPVTSVDWVLKGGTCLKKCYFETYRFSEDLDFTLSPGAAYEAEALIRILGELAAIAHELSGIAFPSEAAAVSARQDKLGRETFQGKIGYRGPLEIRSTPRILFDLTRHEPILAEPRTRPVFHAYPDDLPDGTAVKAYCIEELFAEKTRALLERTRPRDLYDVVFVLDNRAQDIDLDAARGIFARKCEAKGIVTPSSSELLALVRSSSELRAEWENMLAHQLPTLPPFEAHLARLEAVLGWIDATAATRPELPRVGAARTSIAGPAGGYFWGIGVPLETVRFAGVNRLLVEFDYHGKHRRAEPYSLRRASTSDLLLYAWELGAGSIKAFKVLDIRNLHVTSTPFAPRFRVEFSPTDGIGAPPVRRATPAPSGGVSSGRRRRRER